MSPSLPASSPIHVLFERRMTRWQLPHASRKVKGTAIIGQLAHIHIETNGMVQIQPKQGCWLVWLIWAKNCNNVIASKSLWLQWPGLLVVGWLVDKIKYWCAEISAYHSHSSRNALFVPAPHLSIYAGITCSCTDFSQRNPVFLQAPQYYIPHPFSPIRHLTEILKLESLLPLSPFSFMVRQA